MNPDYHHSVDKAKEDATIPSSNDDLMTWLVATKTACELQRSRIEYRAARNMRLVKGLPVEDQSTVSNVRKRNKMYFRKIWSAGYRLAASMYQAFLSDMNQFALEGRDDDKDPAHAKVLQKMVEYYRDRLLRKHSLFVQLMWNFLDIIFIGDTNGKMYWHYDEETGADYLDYKAYPMEQVGRDWTAVVPDEMRYCYFDNYMTRDQMEEMGYDKTAIKNCMATSVSSSPLRSVRYWKSPDPLMNANQNPETTYPESGTGAQPPEDQHLTMYRVTEWFYRKGGHTYSCVINPEGKQFLKKVDLSPYGKTFPLITGSMLLEPHKAWGEGIPESGEGPQESLNYNLNVRKDNVDMALRVRPIYDRDANIDMAALLDHKTGMPIGVDGDVNAALKFDRPPDVTQSSYMEGTQDINTIDEYCGTNPTKQGNTNVDKTGVAQINQQEGNAKIDLFIATVSETFFRQFYYTAAKMVSKFATDQKVFDMANTALLKEDQDALGPNKKFIYDVEDMDVDVIVNVGAGTVGKQVRIQQLTMFIGQAIQSNNVMALMLKSGIQPQADMTMINISKLLIDIAPELGVRNVKDYEIPIKPPQQQGNPIGQQAAGAGAPQPNNPGLDDAMSQILPQGGSPQ